MPNKDVSSVESITEYVSKEQLKLNQIALLLEDILAQLKILNNTFDNVLKRSTE